MSQKILLIYTGGTIAGKAKMADEEQEKIKTAEDFIELLTPTIDYLEKTYDIEIDLDTYSLCNIDSSDIEAQHWTDMAAIIKRTYDDHDSFVITHGTNTLGYTCAALSFALANLNKPVIVTGSQVPAGLPGSDAATNLDNAVRVAVWKREKNPIKGVLAVFGSHIITGTRVKKDTEFDYDAFKSFSIGSIGRIGRIINISEQALETHLSYLSTAVYPQAKKAKDTDLR